MSEFDEDLFEAETKEEPEGQTHADLKVQRLYEQARDLCIELDWNPPVMAEGEKAEAIFWRLIHNYKVEKAKHELQQVKGAMISLKATSNAALIADYLPQLDELLLYWQNHLVGLLRNKPK